MPLNYKTKLSKKGNVKFKAKRDWPFLLVMGIIASTYVVLIVAMMRELTVQHVCHPFAIHTKSIEETDFSVDTAKPVRHKEKLPSQLSCLFTTMFPEKFHLLFSQQSHTPTTLSLTYFTDERRNKPLKYNQRINIGYT